MALLFLNPVTIICLLFLAETTIIGCFGNGDHSQVVCIEREKQALLSLKQDFVDRSNKLMSWNVSEEEDCCKWDRVVCSNITGHVFELRLNDGFLEGKINPSLLNLTHLTHLDLSSNNFGGISIPNFMGSLVSLRYLNLTREGFMGMVPYQLGNLSGLHHLGLGVSSFYSLYVENLHWLSGLSSLETLDMTSVNLSKASDHWFLAINTLPSLTELRLSSCGLRHIQFPSHLNLTSLEVLALSSNHFEDPIPSAIQNLTSIISLDLSSNALFQGKIPRSIGNLCNLESIDLSNNEYSGEISHAFESLLGCLSNRLQSLRLDGDHNFGKCFTGQIPDEIGEFKDLVYLSISGHNIYGPIPMSIGKLSALKSLNIADNQLNGSLPESIGSLSNLEYLYLYKNELKGSLPKSFGSLSNLEVLEMYSNNLEGPVSEVHFANLTNLREIIAYGNQLSLKVSPYWSPPFHLHNIELASWNLGPKFPMWLKSQENFSTLDLSNTGISDAIPNWFWNLSTNGSIDLSQNQIYGEIPFLPAAPLHSFREIILYSNKFSGPLPRISSAIGVLDLSNNSFSGNIFRFFCDHPIGDEKRMYILNLKDNLLSGEFPSCWKHWPSLGLLDLNNNNVTGEIPRSMGSLQNLWSLNLRNNSLTGKVPGSLKTCPSLYRLDLSLNEFVGTIPRWIGTFLELEFLGLRSNKLTGHIPAELCAVTTLKILDFADNMLSGTIPKCFGNFTAMTTRPYSGPIVYSFNRGARPTQNVVLVIKGRERQFDTILYLVTYLDLSGNKLSGEIPSELAILEGLQSLNLSGNSLRGSIPNKIGNMTRLESLDLSRNHLSGEIPPGISNLTFLSYLNLSYNNLSGEIPTSTQLQSLDASAFVGNQLYGPPLGNSCREGEKTTHRGDEDGEGEREEEEGEEYWFHLGIAVGFGVGFLGVIAPLLFCRIWRHAYFWFFQQYLWYKILDCFIKFRYILHN
ncbi:Leucine-rich repeat domain containing protein [Trema orientale]|uniref:Leucine-rich repeat domain containing protein n=1 Tax=Trema orientale TaxID=63057 RepID=A0A2P5CPU4_TREOI|nr:Leucine-rich repeat domain containing protein [Trema orientale]